MNGIPTVRRFVCGACGHVHAAWAPRCASCFAHGLNAVSTDVAVSVVPTPPAPAAMQYPQEPPERPRLMIARAPSPEPELSPEELADVIGDELVPLSDLEETTFVRTSTNLAPLDHVLGGGLVVASVVLLASPPGIGKTSLTLQMLNGLGHRCLYVTGEETREQVAGTARRIGAASRRVYPIAEQDLDKIFAKARSVHAQTIAIDSIQKMKCNDVNGRPGSPAQLKECTARLVQFAKTSKASLWLIGHVTGDGDIAGPKTIEHDVDVVLELTQGGGADDPFSTLKRLATEQPDLSLAEALRLADEASVADGASSERVLRCPSKNRFGATNVEGRFHLTATGFVAVDADGWNVDL